MKKIMSFIWIFLLGMAGFQVKAQNETAIVEDVLKKMMAGTSMNVSDYITPAYLQAHKVEASDYQINTYSPKGWKIEENRGNGLIIASIWGEGKSWIHRLYFIVVKANGKNYLMPGREPSTYKYIDPWFRVETNVTDYKSGGGSGGSGGGSVKADEARKLVERICNDMVNDQDNFGTSARKYIAPSYYSDNYISKSDYQINYYSPKGYEVVSANEGGKVIAHIWGEGKSWTHELEFKVVRENGVLYVMPGGHTDNNYIHPWMEVLTDVGGGSGGGEYETTTEDPMEEVVVKILDRMTYDKDGFGEDMRLYIAPSYFKNNSLDPYSYLVNSYSPTGYSIVSNNGSGLIKAQIWGSDRSWVHELTFKVVKESGLYYVMPGKHYSSTKYVDPWYSARTNI